MESNKIIIEENSIKKVLSSEVKFVVGIIIFVFGIAGPFYGMKQDIALIQSDINNINTNHEAHIQDLTQQIKDLNTKQIDLQQQIINLLTVKK